MAKTLILSIILTCFITLHAGCKKEDPKQVYDLPGIETTISKIQISPLAYDRARVAVKGIIVNITGAEDGNSGKREIIISDAYQNTQKIVYEGETEEFESGDLVLISGIFDRSTKTIITDRIMKIPYKEKE